MTSANPSESQTLRAIMDYLDAKRILYVRHSPSNVVGKKGEATFRRPRASQLGAPDLIVFPGNGQAICFEVKRPKGELSTEQKSWWLKADHAGVAYWLVYSVDQVIDFLSELDWT